MEGDGEGVAIGVSEGLGVGEVSADFFLRFECGDADGSGVGDVSGVGVGLS